MAHTKAQGAVKGNRDSRAKRRGVKLYGGQKVEPGNIIVRQQGSKFHAGNGVMTGKDYTLFAVEAGIVNFTMRRGKKVIEVIHG
jgi:large subunit ribosomal protein L27